MAVRRMLVVMCLYVKKVRLGSYVIGSHTLSTPLLSIISKLVRVLIGVVMEEVLIHYS